MPPPGGSPRDEETPDDRQEPRDAGPTAPAPPSAGLEPAATGPVDAVIPAAAIPAALLPPPKPKRAPRAARPRPPAAAANGGPPPPAELAPPGPPREAAPPPPVPPAGPLPVAAIEALERDAGADAAAEAAAQREEPAPIAAGAPAETHGPAQYLRPGIPPMSVVMVAAELSPVAKVGGLADVVFGLSRELEIRGNSVEIMLPKYDCLRWEYVHGLTPVYQDLWVPWYGGAIHTTVFSGAVYGRKCLFLEPHSADRFFARGQIHGQKDDVLRFAFFSRAALEFLFKTGRQPDIIHCHDWQAALVPVLLYEIYESLGLRHPRVCFTIHNFKHQGVGGEQVLRATGLNRPAHFFHPDRLGGGPPGALNLLKGGIVYGNFVNTVSPTYAGEARDRGGAFGLEAALRTHQVKYGGILNGIDYDVWNPEKDGQIPAPFSAATIERKYDNKLALRRRLFLADNAKPIVAYIGRLDAQKGLDLVRHAIFYCINHGAQFVLLGSGVEAGIDHHFRHLKQQINDNPDSHLEIGFNEELSHLIYAGADLLIVPSRFEPCGLTQLIALRYGTIPVVRAVGGLADTVFDKDYSDRPLHERNGYVFHHDDLKGIESALSRAIACYYLFPDHFRQLMLNAMRCDYSWNVPGQHYLNVYDFIRDK